jgi:transcriptional regulator with XRE-family HTH domain
MLRKRVLEPLGERLARLRRERGVTQQELARRIGLAQSNVSDYERGIYMPNAAMIIQIARTLSVSADELLGLERVHPDTGAIDRAILRRLRKISALSRRDRQAVLRTLDAFLGRGNGNGRH